MQLQVKLKTRTEIAYLEANKQQTRYCPGYLQVFKQEKRHDCGFEE